MITGYFCVTQNRVSIKKVVAKTLFYSLVVQVVAVILRLGTYGNLIRGIVPISAGTWWFVSSYIMLILCAPYLNFTFNRFSRNEKILAIIFSWIFLYLIPYCFNTVYYNLERGVIFYLIGAFIRTEVNIERIKLHKIGLGLISCILWVSYIPIGALYYSQPIKTNVYFHILDGIVFNGIIICGCSVLLFLIFASINEFANVLINKIAKATFGVYLLHDCMYRNFLWNDVLRISTQFQSKWFPLLALGTGLLIFTIATMVDLGRDTLFKFATKSITAFLMKPGNHCNYSSYAAFSRSDCISVNNSGLIKLFTLKYINIL